MLVRARDPHEAEVRLWQALQLHMDFPRFYEYLQTRIRIFRGDLTDAADSACREDDYDRLIHTTDSVIHCAASLNRKSEKSCLNVNLRGTLEVVQLARRVASLSRPAALQPREHGGGGRQAAAMKSLPKTSRSIGIGRITIPTRAPRSSAST